MKYRMTFVELILFIMWSQKSLDLMKFSLACQILCIDITIKIMSFLFFLS